MCIEDAVRMAGGSVIYTRVGSPVVARVMKERNAVFGGEENGGLIFPEFQYCRDGGMSVAKVLEIVAKRGKMSDLLDSIPAYSQCKTKTSCPDKLKEHVMDKLASEVTGDRVDRTDGVKIFTVKGWVLVRPSGTEPIFRIFSEARTPQEAEELAESFKSRVEKLVKAKR
jgi:phosphomannomutase/phosphoglucomutase